MDVQKMTGRIGAAIGGVDLAQPIGEALADALKDTLAEHQVVVFPDQNLDLAAQKRLTQAFGPMIRTEYIDAMPDEPFVIRVLKEADEAGGTFGGDWHSDLSFLPEPIRSVLDGRDAIHVGKPYGVRWAPPMAERSGASITMRRGDPKADEEVRHPAVFTHPRSGRRGLFMNPTYAVRLDGMSEAESRPLLDQIQRHALRPEFQMRLRWRPGMVAVWDNFQTQHYAVNDYFGQRRLMYRTTFGGPPPAA